MTHADYQSANLQLAKHSVWTRWITWLSGTWLGRRLGIEARLRFKIWDNDSDRFVTIKVTPEEAALLSEELTGTVSFQRLDITEGEISDSELKSRLKGWLDDLKQETLPHFQAEIQNMLAESRRLESAFDGLLAPDADLSTLDPKAFYQQLHELLELHQDGIHMIQTQLSGLVEEVQEEAVSLHETVGSEDSADSASHHDLLRDFRTLNSMLEVLPEKLRLEASESLTLMLENESRRLDLLVQDLCTRGTDDVAVEDVKRVLDEFMRIKEVLHHDVACSPALACKAEVLAPFSAKIREMCRHFEQFCGESAA